MAKIGEKVLGFNRLTKMLSPFSPDKLNSHAVTVVPKFAPMMTPTALESFIIPELTNPTTMTVVVDEDCIKAVTNVPTKKPLNVLLVIFSRSFSSFPPDSFSRPSPMVFMPNRNNASPATKLRTVSRNFFPHIIFFTNELFMSKSVYADFV